MKRTALLWTVLCILPISSGQAADTLISPGGDQDGAIYGPDPCATIELPSPNQWVGAWQSGPGFWTIGMHSLGSLTVGDVPQALLRIPQTDMGGVPGDVFETLNLDTFHIDAVSDTTISCGDDTSAALAFIGVYRAPSPLNPDEDRFVEFDVTDQVHADINAGRATFAWRIQQDPVAGVHGYTSIPASEADGTNKSVLIIKEAGTVESDCNDGVDNDGDGDIDCADADCSDRFEGGQPVCPEDCGNGIDDDGDGAVDCDDSECADDPNCPEAICVDGIDNDGDGLTDCDDPDCCVNLACADIEPCTETNCSDGLDGDNDGMTDCDDSDCATSFACGGGELCIKPVSEQDGNVVVALDAVDTTSTVGTWGKSNGEPWAQIGIHTLPAGITGADIGTATLTVARTDNAWTANVTALDLRMLMKHIDAADDAAVTVPDGSSAALGNIGVYREPGPYVADNSRSIELNVTSFVKADADAGRTTFAWRVEPESVPDTVESARYFPTVDNTDGAFPADIRGATLCLTAPGVVEDSCTDGIDNDENGLIDCEDPFCADDPACPEICNNGIDDDADGNIDCDDDECLGDPGCPEGLCNDGLDNDQDGLTDCADPDCFGALGCESEAGFCDDGEDNDNDCLIDGGDPDCGGAIVVRPVSTQDGHVAGDGSLVDTGSPFGLWGSLDTENQIQVVQAGIHDLPAIAAGDVVSAELRIPEASLIWTAGGTAMLANDVDALHIDAADDTMLTAADGTSASLANLGRYRNGGDPQGGVAAFTALDATAAVQADLTAGRATFAWRLNVLGELPLGTGGENNPQLYFPTVDSQDGAFPPANRGARLILRIAGQFEDDCTDGVDNDGDGAVDCDDADCYESGLCGEICGDGLDNDNDSFLDCDDADCLLDPCCEVPLEICTNGVDDNGNELVDCEDPDCACAPNCGPFPAEVCDDGVDNDCDGNIDCADSDCAIHPACSDCNDPFADAEADGDVDQKDFARFQLCLTGSGGGVPTGCECYDRDVDGDIDTDDFAFFELCASGPGLSADPACDD